MNKRMTCVMISLLSLTGCKLPMSGNIDLGDGQNITAEMAEYAQTTLEAFYDYDLETVFGRIDPRVADKFSLKLLEQINENTHETAQAENSVKYAHHYRSENGLKFVTIEYNVPNQNGREDVTISLSYEENICCKLVDLHVKPLIGQQYKMPEYRPLTSP